MFRKTVSKSGMAAPDDEGAQPLDAARLFEEHSDTVAGWAARLGGPSIDVEDVVQEVFVTLHRRLHRFRGDSNVTSWLFGITANIVYQQRRKAKRRRWFSRPGDQDADEVVANQPTPLENVERRRRTLAVYRVLDAMRETNRSVPILFEVEGVRAVVGIGALPELLQLPRQRSLGSDLAEWFQMRRLGSFARQ